MCSRNLFVLDFARRFFVSCAQIFEAYAVRTLIKFGCDWRKIGRKGKCMKDSESTLITTTIDHSSYLLSLVLFCDRMVSNCQSHLEVTDLSSIKQNGDESKEFLIIFQMSM